MRRFTTKKTSSSVGFLTSLLLANRSLNATYQNYAKKDSNDARAQLSINAHQYFGDSHVKLEQKKPIDLENSDHKSFSIDFRRQHYFLTKIMTLFSFISSKKLLDNPATFSVYVNNMMMQANVHNNGFGKKEDKMLYRTRIYQIALEIADYLLQNPDAIIHLQEFAKDIEDRKLFMDALSEKGIEHTLHVTDYMCVATLLPKNSPFHRDEATEEKINQNKLLYGRFLVFKSSDSYYMVNAHLPFRNTTEAYKAFYKIMLENRSKEFLHDLEKCVIHTFADTNLSPSEQRQSLKELFNEFSQSSEKNMPCFSAKSFLLPSMHGHLKQIDGEKKLVSVDSFQSLHLTTSTEWKYEEQSTEQTEKEFNHFVTMLIGGSGLMALGYDCIFPTSIIASNQHALFEDFTALEDHGFTKKFATIHSI